MILSELRRSEFIMCSELTERFTVFLCGEDQRGCGWIQGKTKLLQRELPKPGKLKGLPHLRQSISMVGMVCLGGFEPPAFTFGVCHSIP